MLEIDAASGPYADVYKHKILHPAPPYVWVTHAGQRQRKRPRPAGEW